ncbi:hypothetical protein DNTS_016319 [Danionella cerebrum]|nr:hypothetical protein DNTS_016319 [Danionella translucida]
MEGSMLTLSLANWMELPGLKLKDWMRDKRRNVRNDRATPAEIASYYQHYVTKMGLEKSFACGTTVTSVSRVSSTSGGSFWNIKGLQRRANALEENEVPFSVYANNVVLATGTHDIPARLGVDGENLPFVCHSFWELEAAISSSRLDRASEPVLIVGAGLTAADAVLAAHHLNTPVYHAFRRPVSDPALIFNQLPKLLYPEYHKVHQMMSQEQHKVGERVENVFITSHADGSRPYTCYPGYRSFPKHHVVAFKPDGKCVLESEEGIQTVLQVSMALVLIGAHPNLSFLPEQGRSLGLDSEEPVSCRRNPIEVDPYTYESLKEPGMYAMGPLVGENFVRFLKGGALGIACSIAERMKQQSAAENCTVSSLNIQLTNCTLEA